MTMNHELRALTFEHGDNQFKVQAAKEQLAECILVATTLEYRIVAELANNHSGACLRVDWRALGRMLGRDEAADIPE